MFEFVVKWDGWLLRKLKRLIRIIRLFGPILKILMCLILGAGFTFVYTYGKEKSNIIYNGDYYCKKMSTPVINYNQITDNSQNNANAKQELKKLQSKTMNLERLVYQMNYHLKNLYNYQKNMDINLADFASESIGAFVVSTPDTKTYQGQKVLQLTLFGMPIWKTDFYSPRTIIQPWTQAGECWAFCGSRGKIEIELAANIIIDKITLEHIPENISPSGKIDSAPKLFNVLGKVENKYIIIGTFMYKNKEFFSQTFDILNPDIKELSFKRIILEILSNHGNPHYTCIYRFKVHGQMYNFSDDENKKNIF